jgi:histidyl-tRNA synthetase
MLGRLVKGNERNFSMPSSSGATFMKNIVQPVKGTRDFYPEQMALRTWLYDMVRRVSESFGYQEWEAPILETIDLYAAKSGDELVNQQSFVFPDRGGDLITLRPELTPSLARMVAQRQNELAFPLRWWSFGPFWRYERPQRGRTREFFQWNIDLIGVDSPEADAELVAIAATFLKEAGLSPRQAVILVNDRKLVNDQLDALDIPSGNRPDFLSLIDRRLKMKPEDWEQNALDLGMSLKQLDGMKAFLSNSDLWKRSDTLVRVFAALQALGVEKYIRYDSNIIRGLLYYTSTVFEAFDMTGGVRRAILGGGRYDNLMAQVGGDPLPAVGFAMGDVVLSLVLESLGLLPANLGRSPADVLVTVFSPDLQLASMKLAADLRSAGLKSICATEIGKLQKQFKFADRMGMKVALVLGPDEAAVGKVAVKDLSSGTQVVVECEKAAEAVRKILESQ